MDEPGNADHDRFAILQREIVDAITTLAALRADIDQAEAHLQAHAARRLLEANEQLVLTMLRVQADADAAEAALQAASHSAGHDTLTRLPNRSTLHDRYAQGAAQAQRQHSRMALLFIDLDDFKIINDTMGHQAGDALLVDIAARLTRSLRGADTVCRFGGDEFVVLVPDISSMADVAPIARKLLAAVAEPLVVRGRVLEVKASIGISVYPDDASTESELLELADAAMYSAKAKGGGTMHFHALPTDEATSPHPRERDTLRQALEDQARMNHVLRQANEQLVLAALGATELQQDAEQALARHQAYLALLGHEIRNPLTPLRYAAAVLDRGPLQDGALTRLKATIERQVVQISRLVDDMLALATTSRVRLDVERRSADIVALARQAVEACRPSIDGRHQQLHFAADAPVQEARVDAVRIVQVITNLIDNASKYTQTGGRITVTVTGTADEVSISVADDGMGIASPDVAALFEPFLRSPEALASRSSGLGIGLTVVRELVAAHGGTVEGRSQGAGRGSDFLVRLPR